MRKCKACGEKTEVENGELCRYCEDLVREDEDKERKNFEVGDDDNGEIN